MAKESGRRMRPPRAPRHWRVTLTEHTLASGRWQIPEWKGDLAAVEYAPGVPIEFRRLAVTEQQITDWSLPTRPAKKSDPEAAKFGDRAVELDAIDPNTLNGLLEEAIVEHIDPDAWLVEQACEEEERKGLLALTGSRS